MSGLVRKERRDGVEIRMSLCAVTRRGQTCGGMVGAKARGKVGVDEEWEES